MGKYYIVIEEEVYEFNGRGYQFVMFRDTPKSFFAGFRCSWYMAGGGGKEDIPRVDAP